MTKIIENLESFTFIQNVQNNSEYFANGPIFDIIEGLEIEQVLSDEAFIKQRSKWMFDEFIICRLPLKAKIPSSDLFFHCNYANSENPEAWKEQYNSMTVTETALNDFEFKDIFGWGINEWLFDHSPVSINIDFTSALSKRQILDSTNPLFLYCEFQEHQYLFNYNGYT